MAEFRYNALNASGEQVRGAIEASSRALVLERVVEMGLTPIMVTASKKGLMERLTQEREFFNSFGDKSRALFCRSIARFLQSGLTLERALTLSAEMVATKAERSIIERLCIAVRKGSTLSAAMMSEDKCFPEDMIAQISAAERTATLDVVMVALATSLERSVAFKSRVQSALTYPSILMVVVVLTLLLVVGVVLPQFAPLFSNAGRELPLLTRVVMGFGEALTNFWWFWILLFTVLIGLLVAVKRDVRFREKFHELVFGNVWCRRMILMPDYIRISRSWGSGLLSGLPADEGLSITLASIKNICLQKRMVKMVNSLRQGGRLSSLVREDDHIPVLMQQLALAGDETGRLGAMLCEAANLMETDYELRLERTTGLLAPILTLVSGGIVALLVLAVMMGMMSVNDLAF